MATVARTVNMRAEPSTSGRVLLSLKGGTQVAVLTQNGNWQQVEIVDVAGGTQKGWIYSSYLTATEVAGSKKK